MWTGTILLRCGTLPGLQGMPLIMADFDGIIGNEILRNSVLTPAEIEHFTGSYRPVFDESSDS